MRKVIYTILAAVLLTGASGCKKFLNVTPIDALSGNNFWESRDDLESYMNGIYSKMRSKVAGGVLIPALDVRGNLVKVVGTIDNSGNAVFNRLITSDMKPIMSGTSTYDNRMKDIMNWKGWYDVIQASNILYEEADNVPSSAISAKDRKHYKAEAVFMRNLSYLFLVKLYGDAIYYTEAYHNKSLARMPKLMVLNNAIADMSAVKDDLPIELNNAASVGYRASRGSAVALLIHLNMWAAAWDENEKKPYYEEVLKLVEELKTFSNHSLLPVTEENTKKMFKGNSKENLFGLLQDFNYEETFPDYANYSHFFSRYPYRGQTSKATSFMTYEKKYIEKVYPVSTNDDRRTTWFENYNTENDKFQFKKFINVYSIGAGSSMTIKNDDSAIIFRMSDAVLYGAEAAAELGEEALAHEWLNEVREAANAPSITSSGEKLKEDIYLERCRELIGEGHFYFDLVRTRRVINSEFSKAVMSVSDFNNGAWTWPLIFSSTELTANDKLTGNTFWN